MYIHTMEYYSSVKETKLLIHAVPLMNLKNMLSEIIQIQKNMYPMIPLT